MEVKPVKTLELRKVSSNNRKYRYIYTVYENGKAIVKLKSRRDFEACYIVEGRITTDAHKASKASAFAYTFTFLLNHISNIKKII